MSLRRLAQANNAAAASPRASVGGRAQIGSRSPLSPAQQASLAGSLPTTPRTRLSYPITPSSTSSLSASVPFDWDAAKTQKPPPYATPEQSARLRAMRKSEANSKAKRMVRKRGIVERITSVPSDIMFELALFPHNVPMPAPKTSARILGGLMHFTHFLIQASKMNTVPDDELSWEDLYHESRGSSWFDWTLPLTLILITSSIVISIRLFTTIKLYNFHLRKDPVSSPRASMVNTELDFSPLEPPALWQRFLTWLYNQFSVSWRFFFNVKPPTQRVNSNTYRVQQLNVWSPGELEMELFSIYSPVHAFIWYGTNVSNWIIMFSIMAIVSAQIHLLTHSYQGLLKDKDIIAAEVMHEYDTKYVNPRLHPIRKDAAVMTHQAEVVNVWED